MDWFDNISDRKVLDIWEKHYSRVFSSYYNYCVGDCGHSLDEECRKLATKHEHRCFVKFYVTMKTRYWTI